MFCSCGFDAAGYRSFVQELCAARKVEPKPFEQVRYFEGCLPIEVMAERGEMTLAFGPMKPVGLTDPKTGRRRNLGTFRSRSAAEKHEQPGNHAGPGHFL